MIATHTSHVAPALQLCTLLRSWWARRCATKANMQLVNISQEETCQRMAATVAEEET